MTKPATRTAEDAETAAAERWLDQLDPETVQARDATHVRAIIAAAEDLAAAERRLHETVAQARAAGDSWTVIGAALGTTRQAAQMRFRSVGTAVDRAARTGTAVDRAAMPGTAIERAARTGTMVEHIANNAGTAVERAANHPGTAAERAARGL